MSEPSDDLADLLVPQLTATSTAFRELVLLRTERRLARARWVRRGVRVATLAGVLVVGGLAGWLARPERPGERPGSVQTVFVPVAIPVPLNELSSSVAHSPPLTASAVELRAEQQDDPIAAATLYRQAGDAFLREQDYSNATRCYRLYLACAGDPALSLDTNDSWLLVSLKNAAFREKIDVTKNDG